MRRTLTISILALLCLTATRTRAHANDIKTAYFQGALVDPSGNAMPDGKYKITFAFYDAPSGGNKVWTETQEVYVRNGEFTAVIGATHPLDLEFTPPRWLSVGLSDDATFTDRTEFSLSSGSLDEA